MSSVEPGSPAEVFPDQVEVLVHRLDPGLPVPGYARPGDAGADLSVSVDVVIAPGERVTVPTGLAIALPEGYAGFVHPRSGLAARSGITIVNAPGTVDAGYRGEIRVTLLNTDTSVPVHLRRGDRIAQLVVQRVSRATFVEVERLPDSVRGIGGFGSTGLAPDRPVLSSSSDSMAVPALNLAASEESEEETSVRGNTARGQGEI